MSEKKYAIRFGLGAIKAVGLGMMEIAVEERKKNGKFKDVYDFSTRLDPKSVNKKSIEALAKSGSFDDIANNRRQIFESFDVLSSYAAEKKEEATSNQMSLFGGLASEMNSRPELKKVPDWTKEERLQKEFEAFGFFLNEHPLDDHLDGLKRRGVVFCEKLEKDEFEDNNLVKMAGVVAASKHRSSARGRFAYMTISDPFGIYEAMIFDEAIITNARDILVDGSAIVIECLIKKDEGGVRILIREVLKLEDFLKQVPMQKEPFEDIKKQKQRQRREGDDGAKRDWSKNDGGAKKPSFGAGQASGFSGGSGGFSGGNSGGAKNYAKPAAGANTGSADALKLRMEKLEAKQIFSEIYIHVKEREPILTVKIMLSQMQAPPNFSKKTKVFFTVEAAGQKTNIELPQAYLLDEADVARIAGVAKVLSVQKV